MNAQMFDRKTGFVPEAVLRSEMIDIAAPAAVVWQILTDLDKYGEWNPFCVHCTSTLEMGAAVNMSLVDYVNPGRLMPNVEYVCAFEPCKRPSWEVPWTEQWPYPGRRALNQLQLDDTALWHRVRLRLDPTPQGRALAVTGEVDPVTEARVFISTDHNDATVRFVLRLVTVDPDLLMHVIE